MCFIGFWKIKLKEEELDMKSMLIIGGDHLGQITKKLEGEGFKEVIHLNGRKKQMIRKEIPKKVDLILVLTDFINHNLSGVIKRQAQEQGIPICFSKRSWCLIYEEIQKTQIKGKNKQLGVRNIIKTGKEEDENERKFSCYKGGREVLF